MALKIEKSKNWTRTQSQSEGSFWEICLFALFFIVIFSAVSRANASQTPPASTSVSTSSVTAELSKDVRKVTAKLVVETTRTLQEDEPESYSGSYDFTLGLMNVVPKWNASARVIYSREYTYEKDDGTDGQLENPSFGLSRKWTVDKGIDSLTWRLSGSIPGNREAERRTFKGSLGTSVSMAKAIRRFDLTQTFGYTRGFYEYDIRADGTVNSPDSFKSTSDISLNVTDKLALSASVAITHAINYQGNGKSTEASAVSVDYSFTDKVQASLGVATERGTLTPDGEANRVKLYDPEVAQAFFDLVLSL